MQLAFFILLIPLLGVGLLLTDAQRQTAFPFESRKIWSVATRTLGGLAVMASLFLVCWSIVQLEGAWEPISQFLLHLLLAAALVLTGIQTYRLPATWPDAGDRTIAGENYDGSRDGSTGVLPAEVIDRYSPVSLLSDPQAARFRSGAWAITLYPIFFLLPLTLSFGVVLLFLGVVVFGFLLYWRRAFESQLLWLMCMVVRHQQPLAPELRALAMSKSVGLKKRLLAAADALDHGDELWLALERFKLLPAATTAVLRMTEGTSHVEMSLQRLANLSSRRLKQAQSSLLTESLMQALMLIVISAFIVSGVMYFIVPKLKVIFEEFGSELPRSTVALINLSDTLISSTSSFFWAGLALSVVIWKTICHLVGWGELPIPILMHWYPKRDAPEMFRSIAGIAQMKAGFPEKLQELAHRPGRPDLGARYQRISEAICEGNDLSEALWSERVATRTQCDAIAAGQRNRHAEFVLFSLADQLDLREQRRGSAWIELLRPAVVIACGLLTAFLVISLFVPVVKLLNDLSSAS